MCTEEELEKLSSKELHDRAVKLAERRLDVRFFWDLLELIPAAEAAAGDIDDAELDVQRASALVEDALVRSDDPPLADALRPFYTEYLKRHCP